MEKQHSDGWRSPLVLAGLGLALMVAGWKVSTYVPVSAEDAEKERQLNELRSRAEEFDREAAGSGQPKLSERLSRYAAGGRIPPYQTAGRLALYVGLLSFVGAMVLMYRRPAGQEAGPEAEQEMGEDTSGPVPE
jgi:hypothetical protein